PKMAQALELEQTRLHMEPVLTVIMDVPTRWNSTLAMLSQLVQLKHPIASVHTALFDMPDEGDHLEAMLGITWACSIDAAMDVHTLYRA
ncbi:hypothetical protein BGZ52_010520, partial [Haplosporangium bisporale]